MNLPPNKANSNQSAKLPPARRRRDERKLLGPLGSDARSQKLEEIARRASPSFDYFLFSLLSGLVIAFGMGFDSPYLIVLGVFFAPLMAPAVGVALSTAIGSTHHFARNLLAVLMGSGLVMLGGWIVGISAQYFPFPSNNQAAVYAQLRWPAYLLLALAGIVAVATFVKELRGMRAASMLLAFGLFPPLAAAGLGLGNGQVFLFPDGLVVFSLHITWAVLWGALALFIIGFRPINLFGYTIWTALAMAALLVAIGFGGALGVVGAQFGLPTASPTQTATATLTLTASQTSTATITPSPSPSATATATLTPTLTPTLQRALIAALGGSGAFVREEAAGTVITSLLNGEIVEYISGVPVNSGGQLWMHVYIPSKDINGWILQELMFTSTPAPAIASPSPVP